MILAAMPQCLALLERGHACLLLLRLALVLVASKQVYVMAVGQ
jgi:hypothetical protein